MVSGHDGSNPTSLTPPIYLGKKIKERKSPSQTILYLDVVSLKALTFQTTPTPPPKKNSQQKKNQLWAQFLKNTSLTPTNATRMDRWGKKACPNHTHTWKMPKYFIH